MVKTTEMTSSMSSNYEVPEPSGGNFQMNQDPESLDSDYSIINSPPSENGKENCDFNNFNGANMLLSQMPSETSIDEMYSTIQNLLEENSELKQTIHKDHAAMQSHFETMINAKEQFEAILKDQNDKREQAKLCIQQLREENSNMKDKLAQAQREKIISYELQIREMKSEIENQKIFYHQLKADNDELLADYNQLKQTYDIVVNEKKDVLVDLDELKDKFEKLNLQRELAIETPSFQIIEKVDFEQNASEASSKLEKSLNVEFNVVESDDQVVNENANMFENEEMSLQSADTSIKNLLGQLDLEHKKLIDAEKELENEKLKSEKLLKRIDELNDVVEQLSEQQTKVQTDEKHFESNLQDSERKFALANSYLQKYKDRCDSLETWLNVYQGKLDTIQNEDSDVVLKLRGEVQDLRKTLEDEKRRSEVDKQQLEEERHKNETLMQEHLQLKDTWETMFQDPNQRSQTEAYHLLQIKACQEREDSIHAKMVLLEERLKHKEDELENTHAEVLKLRNEMENVPLLQAQLDVYRSDFEEERRCREVINGEKEQLVFEVSRLRNEIRSNQTTVGSERPINDDEWTIAEPNAPDDDVTGTVDTVINAEGQAFICPKCNFVFDSFQPLLNHVNNCLDEEGI